MIRSLSHTLARCNGQMKKDRKRERETRNGQTFWKSKRICETNAIEQVTWNWVLITIKSGMRWNEQRERKTHTPHVSQNEMQSIFNNKIS